MSYPGRTGGALRDSRATERMVVPRWSFSHHVLPLLFLVHHFSDLVSAVEPNSRSDFPADFVFGSGSSAYQVEGAAFEDGRTPSIWDTFNHAGRMYGANGDVACDHYHKYKEDVQLMANMGLEAYRLSISWSRLIPNGRGLVNPKGLEFYNDLINEIISHGIQPHITLYHYDLPQALEDEYGGLVNQKFVEDFTAFADVCFKEFGDRVLHWTTFNEANLMVLGGYDLGGLPPGRCSLPSKSYCIQGNSSTEPYIVAHNVLLAHSSAVKLYRRKYKAFQHGSVGFNIFIYWCIPYTNEKTDVLATQRVNDFYIGWFIDPLIFGDYPAIVKRNAGNRIPAFTKEESVQVKGSLDFIGVNHYTTVYIKDDPVSGMDAASDMHAKIIYYRGDTPENEFAMRPTGLYRLLEYLKEVYSNPPVFIHENGQMMQRNGTLNDTARVEYLHAYIGSVLDAVRNGSNTRGYFTWSFLDGFELLDGYNSGFGLYYVDLDDKELRRYPKQSAYWYSNFLNGRSTRTNESDEVEVKEVLSASSSTIFPY